MKNVTIAVTLALALAACATVKHVARTINDAADIACELFFGEHVDDRPEHLQRLTPQQICQLPEIIAPFLEAQRQGQREAGEKLGIKSPNPAGPEEE